MGEPRYLPLAEQITSGFKMVVFSMSNRRFDKTSNIWYYPYQTPYFTATDLGRRLAQGNMAA